MNPNLSRSSRSDKFPVVLKSAMEAMNITVDFADVDPRCTLFLDDNVRNIAAGNAVGLQTALVGTATKTKGCDYAMEKVTDMVQVIPEIWFGGEVRCSRSEMNSYLATTTVGA